MVLHSLWAQYFLVDPAVNQAPMRLLFESSPLAPELYLRDLLMSLLALLDRRSQMTNPAVAVAVAVAVQP
ncbi:Uncharacterised protein [Vibrio cholerae]|uniref:Uncharacterized protein n=1 Tax=Vibrio cholerae TaxID=666 RepID=A0A655WV58_VIBCL|nr:Uncharacterised protein [Vibrio cholerae]